MERRKRHNQRFGHVGGRRLASFLACLVVFSLAIGQGGVIIAQAGGTVDSLPGTPAAQDTGGSKKAAADFSAAVTPKLAATLLTNAQADLQGWRPAPVSAWTQGNVCGAVPSGKCYRELDNVPHKIVFSGLSAGTTYYAEILNEYRDGNSGPFGYDNLNRNLLAGFTDSNASGVSLTLIDNATTCGSKICGHYRLEFTADAASGEVQFNAHLALGAHLWSGSNLSVQLNGSNETVTIPVNEIIVPITAHKFNDLNGNGVQDAGEPDLANWEMTLYKSDCSTQVNVPTGQVNPALTNANGNYTWNVPGSTAGQDGKWCVKETLQAGWTNTTGNLGGVVLLGGTAIFGNKQLQPDLSITKTADAGKISAGDPIGFVITVTNNGQGAAKDVVMTDTLPAGFTWNFDQVSGGWTCGINNLTLTCGGQGFNLASGDSASVHVYAATDRNDCATVENQAQVSASNNPTVKSSVVSVTIECPSLVVTKTADATPVNAGDPVGFTITVKNNGPGVAYNVVLTDTLPTNAGLSWSISPAVTGCSITAGVLTCNFGDLTSGQSKSVHIVSPTTQDTCGQILNVASAKADNNPSVDSNQATIQVKCAAIEISKLADDTTIDAGDEIGFTITVTNTGEGIARDVTMTDTLPTGLAWDFDKVTGGWTCGIAAGVLTCGGAGFDLDTNDSASVHIYATTDATDCGVIQNTAKVTTSNDGSSQASASVTVNCPNVTVVKDPDAGVIDAGDVAEFTITVTNAGPGEAKNVTLADTLPSGIAWSEDSPDCSISGVSLTCNFGDMPAQDVRVIHVSGQTTQADCGELPNTATVSATNEPTAAGSDNSDDALITVLCPGIDIQKDADDPQVDAGEPIGFTITVSNGGPGAAKGVLVEDQLPTVDGVDWTIDEIDGQAPGAQSPCAIALVGGQETLTCDFGTMASTTQHTIHVSSDTDYRACGTIDNTATVTTTNGGSDSDDASIDVNCPPIGIQIVKSGPELAHVGDEITYTFDVSLTTPEPLYDVVVTDDRCDQGAPQFKNETNGDGDLVLEDGEVWHYTCTHVITADDPDPLPNTATVSGTSDDGRNTSDKDDHSVDVIHPAIQIVKTVNDREGEAGDTVTYTFVVTNTGDTTLYDIKVNDDIIGYIGKIDVLEPGDSETLTADYVLPESDVPVVNTGTAEGHDELGQNVLDTDKANVIVVLAENPATPPPPTAFTGSDAARMALIAGALLALGLLALGLGRRREQA